jgi:TRAP-type uncharacterized transport system fused permease subunit
MREFFFKLAAAGYVICFFGAMLYASGLTPFRPTDFFVGMSVCAFIALLSSSKVSRWIMVAAFLFALIGSFDCWHYNSRIWATIQRMHQRQAAEDTLQQNNTNK